MTHPTRQADTAMASMAQMIRKEVSRWEQSGELAGDFSRRLTTMVLGFDRLLDAQVEFDHAGRKVETLLADPYEELD